MSFDTCTLYYLEFDRHLRCVCVCVCVRVRVRVCVCRTKAFSLLQSWLLERVRVHRARVKDGLCQQGTLDFPLTLEQVSYRFLYYCIVGLF